MSSSLLRVTLPVALILLTAAVFGESIHFGFVHYDDPRYVLNNRFLSEGLSLDFLRFAFSFEPAAIHQGVSNWHPLTWLSYGLDVTLFGINPNAMHAINIIIHVTNSLLVFALFDRTTRAPVASACVACLFAIHPLHVEAVVWISERKELLAALFGLLACHAWVGFARRGGGFRYGTALACGALSLLAKPMWVTLPFLLLVLDYWPLQRAEATTRRLLIEKLPFLGLSLLSCAATLFAQQDAIAMANSVPLGERILNALIAPIHYLYLTLWPVRLSILYPHPYLPGGVPPSAITWLAVAIAWAIIVFAVVWTRHRRFGLAGFAWFLVALVPVIGIVQVGEQAIADRYSYVSLLGIFAAVSFGLREGLERLGVRARIIVAGFAAIAFVLLAVRCADQVGVWRNSLTLYESSVASTPNSAALQFNFGNRLLDVGREEEAIRHLESARSLRPDWHSPTANLAWLLATTDDAALVDPDRSLQLALEVTDERGNDANLLDTLAAAYAATGEFDRAESVARRAVSLARAARRSGSARTFEARRRLYLRGQRYVESVRPEETESEGATD